MAWPRWLGGRGGGGAPPARPAAPDAPLIDELLLHRLERLSLAPRRPVAGGLGGEHRSSARASSTDFADYRQYVPGDDFRRIDWNAYGRSGTLYVKLTEAREQLPVHILLDASQSMAWGTPGKLRYASQLAAALGYVSLARYDRLTVTALGETPHQLRDVRGRGRLPTVLSFLSGLRPGGRLDLNGALTSYRVNRRAGGMAILISDLLSPEGFEDGLDHLLSAGLDVIVLQVLSPQELSPAEGGDVELIDAETGEIVEVSLTARMIGIYRERLDRWCADAEAACTRRGVTYFQVRTDTPLEDLFLDQLRRVGILR
ncbi:MAG: DUF58 domain-containing protein [Chloroflexi bacterium]|nr:DUF58 domain-containing protein [Chloroflexota bacterium]